MKINSLKLKDIFSYKGEVVFNFSNKCNLVIGENGFGKTSLINSFKIALHGITKDVLKIGDTSLTKAEYIQGAKAFSGMINRSSKEEGINECFINLNFSIDKNDYSLVRTFSCTNSAYKEHLLLKSLHSDLLLEDDAAQDFINANMINSSLAKFFLFDGEKVQDIANFSSLEFAKMLEEIFGDIRVYEQLIHDMKILKRDYESQTFTDMELKNKFLEKSKLIENKEKEIERFIKEIRNDKQDLKEVKKSYTVVKNRVEKLKSENKDELSSLEISLQKLFDEREKQLELYKGYSISSLPLILDKEFRLTVEADIFANYYDLNYLPKEVLERKKKEFFELIIQKIKNGEDITNIQKIFDKVFMEDNQDKRVSFVDTTKIKYQYESLELEAAAFGYILDSLIELDTQIEIQKDEIDNLKELIKLNESTLDELLIERETISNKIALTEKSISDYEKHITENEVLIKNTKKEIHTLSMQGHKETVLDEKIKTTTKTIFVATEAIKITKKKKRAELENAVNNKLKVLIKENYEASFLKIYDDFTINLFDKNGKPMDILSSSSGQKQIIATALIWAISDYINAGMPMIVDTPLGRLDDKNQKLLLEKFYSVADNQIIMLPTPSELKVPGFEDIINESKLLKLSSNGSITKVNEIEKEEL